VYLHTVSDNLMKPVVDVEMSQQNNGLKQPLARRMHPRQASSTESLLVLHVHLVHNAYAARLSSVISVVEIWYPGFRGDVRRPPARGLGPDLSSGRRRQCSQRKQQ
jgi:hypothetical protein